MPPLGTRRSATSLACSAGFSEAGLPSFAVETGAGGDSLACFGPTRLQPARPRATTDAAARIFGLSDINPPDERLSAAPNDMTQRSARRASVEIWKTTVAAPVRDAGRLGHLRHPLLPSPPLRHPG